MAYTFSRSDDYPLVVIYFEGINVSFLYIEINDSGNVTKELIRFFVEKHFQRRNPTADVQVTIMDDIIINKLKVSISTNDEDFIVRWTLADTYSAFNDGVKI